MRSRVDLIADRCADGTATLTQMHADGMLAVRQTGPGVVHLVGAAAGPLGGDELEVAILVRAGAHLCVRSVAATLALPGPAGGGARMHLEATVQDGATLDLGLEPLVACRGADVRSTTVVHLEGSGRLRAVEQVMLGRHAEPGGRWSGRTVADRDGHPVLRHTLSSRVVAGARAIVSGAVLRPDGALPWAAATVRGAVACPLAAGGVVVTSIGDHLTTARQDHDAALSISASA